MKKIRILLLLPTFGSVFFTHTAYSEYGKELIWPTPNTAFLEKLDPETYLQATSSGRIESGDWGCTRNGGSKFHEGIDLKSIRKGSEGEILDPIGAIANGVVVHVNREISDSNYGKYIVISHMDRGLEWCSLYAHLSSIEADLHPGHQVLAGDKIGIMGNSSSSITIPKNASHLHFEIVLRLNTKFDQWYAAQDFKSENEHASWNGMNLQGINPFDFYNFFIEKPESPFYAYFLKEPVSFEVLVYFQSRPDFLHRNPIFLRGRKASNSASWYSIGFTWYGLPVDWTPINKTSVDNRMDTNSIYIRNFKHEKPCRNWVNDTAAGLQPTNLLMQQISLLKAGS